MMMERVPGVGENRVAWSSACDVVKNFLLMDIRKRGSAEDIIVWQLFGLLSEI